MNWFKKIWKSKLSRAWLITAVVILIIGVAVNLVATQNYFIYNTINSVFGGEIRVHVSGDPSQYMYYTADYEDKAATLAAANAFNEEIVEEGAVLLKNEGAGALPIATPESDSSVTTRPRISVFGKNSVNLVYGGSGSGGSSSAGATTIYESLDSAGYDCNQELKSFYESSASGTGRPASPGMGDIIAGFSTGETPISAYSDVRSSYASDYKDAALIVLSRIGGEGYDLPRTMKTSYGEDAVAIDGANADDHYLQLDNNERALVEEVTGAGFSNVTVIVNSATPMELGELEDNPAINSIVWIGSMGKTGINALGRILNGEINPSGHTVDTYARDFTKDPTYNNFGNNNVNNGNRYLEDGKNRPYYFVEYEEGIYVGYRYWETAYAEIAAGRYNPDGYDTTDDVADADKWYADSVVYPLGHGLSYTTFEWELLNKEEIESTVLNQETDFSEAKIDVKVRVTNTGDVAGKDVVQVYLNAPYEAGGIEKAEVVLAGFEKTPMLPAAQDATEENPNWCEVNIEVDAQYFMSYDWDDANESEHTGYEIEQGEYELRVSRNAHEAEDTARIEVWEDIEIDRDAESKGEIRNRFDDVSGYIEERGGYLSREDFEGTWPAAPTEEERNMSGEFIDSLDYTVSDEGQKWESKDTPEQSPYVLSYNDTEVKLYDLIGKSYDDPMWDKLLDQLTVSQMVQLIGTGNYNTMFIANIAKPKTIDPDGPVGFTAFMGDPSVYDTCFYASGCVVGATYNKDIAYRMGVMIGNEGLIGNERGDGTPYSGWYAPAVNIHRSPFSGRNWEYYSEDGYLSGIMAANVIRGAKSKGVYCYVKHFALNDQETNRSNNGILVWSNEQAMRELYFRPFELCVKEGETTAMMSSFNRIGKVWAGGSYELLTEVLRDEWGFRGMVITDYNYATAYMNVDQMIRAGGDLNLSQANFPSGEESATQVTALRKATKNILYTVAGSNAMNGLGEGVIYRYDPPMWVRIMLIIDAVIVVVLAVLGFFAIRRSFKLAKARQTDAENNKENGGE